MLQFGRVYMVVVMVIGDGYGVILNRCHVSIVIVIVMVYFYHNSSPLVFQ